MFAVLSFWNAMTPDASLIYSPKSKSRPGLKITILWFDLIRWPGPLVPRELFLYRDPDFVTTYKVEIKNNLRGINGPP